LKFVENFLFLLLYLAQSLDFGTPGDYGGQARCEEADNAQLRWRKIGHFLAKYFSTRLEVLADNSVSLAFEQHK